MTNGPELTTTPTRRRSFASSGLTYDEAARQLGLRLCSGCDQTYVRAKHEDGWFERHPGWDPAGVIHWSSTRVTRRGLYRFLRVAGQLLYPGIDREPRWLALYYTDWHARRLARRFRVRIPAEYGAREKARVRLDLALGVDPEKRHMLRRVQEWAKA